LIQTDTSFRDLGHRWFIRILPNRILPLKKEPKSTKA
jgi:hypothetical protein